jgi:flagellar protein FlaI
VTLLFSLSNPFRRNEVDLENRSAFLIPRHVIDAEISVGGVGAADFDAVADAFLGGKVWEKKVLWLYGTRIAALNGVDANGEYIYRTVEPRIDAEMRQLINFISGNRSLLLMDTGKGANAEEYIETKTRDFIERHWGWVNSGLMTRALYYIKKEFVGIGRLDVLLADERIEDVTISGKGQSVYVQLSGGEETREGYYSTDIQPSAHDYDNLLLRIGQKSGITPNYLTPILDGTMQSNHDRVNMVYGDQVSPAGGSCTIRRVKDTPLSIADLIVAREMNVEMAAWLWYVVEKGASGLIFGSTGSGKTTLLNTILFSIPYPKKVVVIEDTRELRMPNDTNWSSGITRIPSSQQPGYESIRLHDQLVSALRQRPDYIVVGEIRGREAYTLFDAMSTGHVGYGTLHAGGLEDMQNRLANDPNAEGSMYVPLALQNSMDFALHVSQVILSEGGTHQRRRVLNIWENKPVEFREHGTAGLNISPEFVKDRLGNGLFSYSSATDTFECPSGQMLDGYLVDMFASREGKTHGEALRDLNRRAVVLNYIVAERAHLSNLDMHLEVNYYSKTGKLKDKWLKYSANVPYAGGI